MALRQRAVPVVDDDERSPVRRCRAHIQRIFAKLGVHTRAQAVALAYEAGLIRVDAGSSAREVEAHVLDAA